MGTLIEQVKTNLQNRRAAAVAEYRTILRRIDAPQKGDDVLLVELMDHLGRRPEDLQHDAEVLTRAEQLREQVKLLPALTLSEARHANAQKLRKHRRNRAIAKANADYASAAVELKTRFAPELNRWQQAKSAEQQLQALLPELEGIIGKEAAAEFRGLFPPDALTEAFRQAKEEMHAELNGERLDDTEPVTSAPFTAPLQTSAAAPESAAKQQYKAEYRNSVELQQRFGTEADYVAHASTVDECWSEIWEAEFQNSPDLQMEFGQNVETYVAFKRAEQKGLIRD